MAGAIGFHKLDLDLLSPAPKRPVWHRQTPNRAQNPGMPKGMDAEYFKRYKPQKHRAMGSRPGGGWRGVGFGDPALGAAQAPKAPPERGGRILAGAASSILAYPGQGGQVAVLQALAAKEDVLREESHGSGSALDFMTPIRRNPARRAQPGNMYESPLTPEGQRLFEEYDADYGE